MWLQERLPRHVAVSSSSFRQPPSDGQKTARRLCCTFGGSAESYKIVYHKKKLNDPFLGLSSKGEHHVFCKLCRKDFTCAHSGQYDSQKHIKSWFHKNIAEQASMSGNVRAFFVNKEKLAKDNLKWWVTVADVKMCEMIAELNLPLATADSLTHIFIGRELTNFH